MNDLPSDLLRRILTNLLELCRLSTRGVLPRVCKSWAGVVQAHEELFLSPDCLEGLGLLTQDQSQRFNNTLSNIKSLRTKLAVISSGTSNSSCPSLSEAESLGGSCKQKV